MRTPYICGNWKMNGRVSELSSYFTTLHDKISSVGNKVEVGIAPSYTLLGPCREFAGSVKISSQNCHEAASGAFTGEVSLDMLQDLGVSSVIIGHSERRQYYGETDASVAAKVSTALTHGLDVIACVGELQAERESGDTNAVVGRQCRAIFEAVKTDAERLVIAYEPVWAIGTGLTATPAQAQEVHAFIRQLAAECLGDSFAEGLRIQYGGSVKPSNAKELLSQKDIDGALVGGASLKADDFAKIVLAAV